MDTNTKLENKTTFDAYCEQNGIPDLCTSKAGNHYLFFPETGASVAFSKKLRKLNAKQLEQKCHSYEIADVVSYNEEGDEVRIPCAYLLERKVAKKGFGSK